MSDVSIKNSFLQKAIKSNLKNHYMKSSEISKVHKNLDKSKILNSSKWENFDFNLNVVPPQNTSLTTHKIKYIDKNFIPKKTVKRSVLTTRINHFNIKNDPRIKTTKINSVLFNSYGFKNSKKNRSNVDSSSIFNQTSDNLVSSILSVASRTTLQPKIYKVNNQNSFNTQNSLNNQNSFKTQNNVKLNKYFESLDSRISNNNDITMVTNHYIDNSLEFSLSLIHI